ncbi:MAG: M50 family metallopeptidase [Patescibacteria group bacterium]
MPLTQIFGDTTISIIGFLIILSFLVIIHELGHFITALLLKVRIEEFGVGYPPRARVLFHWRGIPFTLNWLPFGGFVKMEGEDGPEEGKAIKDNHSAHRDSHQSAFEPFYKKSRKTRLVVLLAGVVINFIFGIIAFSTVYTVQGFPRVVNEKELVIDQVIDASPAAEAGILSGDRVEAAIAEKSTDKTKQSFSTTTDFVNYVSQHNDEHLQLFFDRQGVEEEVFVYLRPRDKRPEGEGALGVGFAPPVVVYDFFPWWQMPFRGALVGFEESLSLSYQILVGFKTMITGLVFHAEIPQDISGPIGIVHQATKFGLFQSGWDTVLKFTGMLSVNLAILNFLPIPALDGGRAFFVIAEKFIGRKKREQIENKVNYAGFAFLLGLIILISIKDIWSIVSDVFQYFQSKPI